MICKLFSRTIFSIGGKHLPFFLVNAIMRELWGRGSGGRAMRSQRIGQGFESPRLHQNGHQKMSVFFCCKSLISPKSLDDAPRGLAGVSRLPALPCGEPPAPSGLTRRRQAHSPVCASDCRLPLFRRASALLTSPLVSTKTDIERCPFFLLQIPNFPKIPR